MEREMGPDRDPDGAAPGMTGFGAWSYLSPATESDADLMNRAAKGNRTAYGILFGRLSGRLWSFAYLMLHDAAAADDTVHRTFLLGLEQLATYREEETPAAWFCGIALSLCRSALAIAEGAVKRPTGPPAAHGTVVMALSREAARQLAVALGYLEAGLREVFLLRYVEGLSYDEIAWILGIEVVQARSMGHRARAALTENLGRDFMPSASAS